MRISDWSSDVCSSDLAAADVVIVEGAGSPAEINLRKGDIANMGFARAAEVPVILVGDIDCGGAIASIAGTKTVIDPRDAAMIKDFLINKFRGDIPLFRSEEHTSALQSLMRISYAVFYLIKK